MPETELQRKIRRGISAWLTGQVNKVPNDDSWQAAVRLRVLKALRGIDTRFDELETLMRRRYNIRTDRPLVDFYMKGGNAFKVAMQTDLTSGGDSDWDTQVVFDVWAPLPIVDILSGLVEDIALDELRKAGIAIAKTITQFDAGVEEGDKIFTKIANDWVSQSATAVQGLNLSNYTLTLDKPQTIRRIFDHDQLGLWFQAGSPLRDRAGDAESKWIPGLLFNDSIKPFILYRMGYTWHADLKDAGDRTDASPDVLIDKPILMELIDVTIPRRNTVEGVEVWDAIVDDDMKIDDKSVGFPGDDDDDDTRSVRLPFPDLAYHLREQLDMLCEIADGSSRHKDKMLRRFQRLREIYRSGKLEKSECAKIISRQAGVADIRDLNHKGVPIDIDETLYDLIEALAPLEKAAFAPNDAQREFTVNPADTAYRLGVLMMVQVVNTTNALLGSFEDGQLTSAAKKQLLAARGIELFKKLPSIGGVVELAMSDDLVYMNELNRIGYLQLQRVGLCGIDSAVECRVRDEALRSIADMVALAWASEDGNTAETQFYNTARENGYSFECTCVFFTKGKPAAMLTLTTANTQEVPFDAPAEGFLGERTAPLVEVARQRKMAASLIRDYAVRTALSKQYEAGKESIAVR